MEIHPKVRRCSLVLAAVALAAGLVPALMAQSGSSTPPATSAPPAAAAPGQDAHAPSQAEMQEMMKLMSPGEHHKQLGRFVGRWTTVNKMWMAPGQPPTETKGSVEASWIMGGRYVVAHHKGAFMGMPFEGQSIDGYDNLTDKYVSSWIDNMGTGIMNLTGTCDGADCKSLTETAEMIDPMTRVKGTYKSVVSYPDANTFKYEAYMIDDKGASTKMMEITGTRVK